MSEGSWYPMTNLIGTIGTPGDVSGYGSADVAYHTLTTIEWGEEDKDDVVGEACLAFATSIPQGATIEHARLTWTADSTDSDTLQTLLAPLSVGDWSEGVTDPTQTRDDIGVVVWSDMRSDSTVLAEGGDDFGGGGTSLGAASYGVTTIGQSMKATSSASLTNARMRMTARGPSPGGLVWLEVWSVTGDSGNYRPLVLLAESEQIPHEVIFDTQGALNGVIEFPFSGSNQITLSVDTVYFLKLRTNAVLESIFPIDSDPLSVWWELYDGNPAENGIVFGEFRGFSHYIYRLVDQLTAIPSPSSWFGGFYAPSVVAGTSYIWGDAASGLDAPDYDTTLFSTAVQEAVDQAGFTGGFGFRITANPPNTTDGAKRVFRSADYTDHPGPLLTVGWTDPPHDASIDGSPSIGPAVGSAVDVSPGVSATVSLSVSVAGTPGVQ